MPPNVAELADSFPTAPKDPERNAKFRERINEMAWNDRTCGDAVIMRCKSDPVFWVDTFGHCMNPLLKQPHIPMITWPFQARYLLWILERIELGKGGVTEKSRAMTETWTKYTAFMHGFLFDEHGPQYLVGSRKEELVDGRKDPDAIMPKGDYLLERLPRPMLDRCCGEGFKLDKPYRTFKKLVNPKTGGMLKGEATNPQFGRGGRNRAVGIDEAAFCKDLEIMYRSAGMNTNSLFLGSTPNGWETFAELRHVKMPPDAVFRIHWTDHPEWSAGLYRCKPGCRLHSQGGEPHSPRFDAACEGYNWDQLAIAQELEINYTKSGNAVFDADTIKKVRMFMAKNPPRLAHMSLKWVRELTEIVNR